MDVNALDPRAGATALHIASSKGKPEAVALLLELGADLKVIDAYGGTSLVAAVSGYTEGHRAVLAMLLAAGADVNAVDAEGLSALHEASNNGDFDAVETLLASGANVNLAAETGATPLHLAAAGSMQRVDLYSVLGVAPDSELKDIRAAYQALALKLHPDKLVNAAGDQAAKDAAMERFKQIAGAYAVLSDAENREQYDTAYSKTVALLLRAGAGPDVKTVKNETPFEVALRCQQFDMAVCIGGVAMADKHGRTALHHAAMFQKSHVVRSLLAQGAVADCLDSMGQTPLLTACGNGDAATVLELVARADVNLLDESGQSPLLAAVMSGSAGVVKTLLDAGADKNAPDSAGQTALEYAADLMMEDVVKVLRQHSGRGGSPTNIFEQQ
jgi:ankyrin repeat protein